jgi:hypothetical protein
MGSRLLLWRRQAELAFERSLTERLRAELAKATDALAAQKRRADQAPAPPPAHPPAPRPLVASRAPHRPPIGSICNPALHLQPGPSSARTPRSVTHPAHFFRTTSAS